MSQDKYLPTYLIFNFYNLTTLLSVFPIVLTLWLLVIRMGTYNM